MKWVAPRRQRLISFLQERVGERASARRIKRALESNLCRVNGRIERFASSEIDRGAVIELASRWDEKPQTKPQFSVLFEDSSILAVAKPVGWSCNEENARASFGSQAHLVHRLDKDTTGALLLAKNKEAKNALEKLFAEREMEKEYLALVDRQVSSKEGVQKSNLSKIGSFEGQTIWGSRSGGLFAETAWECLAHGTEASLMLCKPFTGRTHQIRVHMAEMGHPILIDRQYARSFRCPEFFQRPLLHAARLSFVHPFTNERLDLKAPLPEDFLSALKLLKIDRL